MIRLWETKGLKQVPVTAFPDFADGKQSLCGKQQILNSENNLRLI